MNKTTEWRAVAGFPNYEVSNDGQVRSYFQRGGYGSKKRAETPRLLKQFIIWSYTSRYFCVYLCNGSGKSTKRRVAHLVAEAFIGPKPAGLLVLHNNGNSLDNRVENLRYGTFADNIADAVRHGTSVATPGRKRSKHFTAAQVNDIRARYDDGESIFSIAEDYNDRRHCVYQVALRRTYVGVAA